MQDRQVQVRQRLTSKPDDELQRRESDGERLERAATDVAGDAG
jgi:hypothetical protein